jgi:ABC-type glycerol-3-phosphate transport system substrate-binding protein
MKKMLFLLVACLVLSYAGILSAVAQEAKTKEAPAAAEKAKEPAVKPETLAGTLQTVLVDKKLLVVAGSNGVPYNFIVSGATKIKVGGNKAKLADLAGATGKSVSVKFLPEKRAGNIAESVEVQ